MARILLVTSRWPWPPWRGNQVRTVQWAEALRDHSLAIVAPGGEDAPEGAPEMLVHRSPVPARAVGLLSAVARGRPLQEGLYAPADARRAVRTALACEPWDLVVIQVVRTAWVADEVRRARHGAALLFDAVDSMGLHFGRRSRLWAPEARRCARLEARLARRASITTAVTERDLEAIGPPVERGRVVPVWVPSRPRLAEPARPVVLLSGNLGYRPTVEGAMRFAEEVWPEVRSRVPAATWRLVGARPSRRIRRLGRLEGVELRGEVPDLGPHLDEAAVAIAPMVGGSGVPMKVLSAWGGGVPVVAGEPAAASFPADERRALAVARDPAEWVEHLVRLLSDATAAADLAERGRLAWAARYSPERVGHAIREAVTSALC